MMNDFTEPNSENERIFICCATALLALNASTSANIRNGFPEWSRVLPFDCLYGLIENMVSLFTQAQANPEHAQNLTAGNRLYDQKDVIQTLRWGRPDKIQSPNSVEVVDPLISNRWISVFMRTASLIAFTFMMTRGEYPWAKAFAVLYELYWLSSCILPCKVTRQNLTKNRSKRIVDFIFTFISHILVLCLCYNLFNSTVSKKEQWLAILSHFTAALLAGVAIGTATQVSPDGTAEAVLYLVHLWFFSFAWLLAFYNTSPPVERHMHLWNILIYDASIWVFAMAKGQRVDGSHWPSKMSAVCFFSFIIIEVSGRGFCFELSPPRQAGNG